MRKNNNRTISLFGGMITIDKTKADENISAIVHLMLSIAQIGAIIAAVIFLLLTIACGGDGRMSNGDPVGMLIFLLDTILCCVGAKMANIMMEANMRSFIRRRKNRQKTEHHTSESQLEDIQAA